MLKRLVAGLFVAASAVAACPAQQCRPGTAPVPDSADHHHRVTSRGDHAMGFSHEKTTHHFLLYKNGGAIEVSANDPKDAASTDDIRMHLSHIVTLFSAGNFNIPMFIHDTTPPGSATMSKLRAQIHYKYQQTERGGRILITSTNGKAVEAIHAFLRFQITDHRTGDNLHIAAK